MSARLRGLAQHTERIVAAGWYTAPGSGRTVRIAEAVGRARAQTRMYGPEALPGGAGAPVPSGEAPVCEVSGESSLDAARRLHLAGGGRVAVLNFASARNPGGGYLNGAQAQEEALCRASALYTCLREAPEFYAAHRADRSPLYSDRLIHSPGVPVFRDERGGLLDVPFRADFLTAAAPNAGVIARRYPDEVPAIGPALRSRAGQVLAVAAAHGNRRLVLGAWGCGVFQNDPAQVAAAFRAHLLNGDRFAGAFDQVVFGVLDRRDPSPVRAAFAREFGAAGLR
ncbi:TIGR02452 family protein [Streptomyces sp. N2-109]|uniref:TIGR02452 family protein n=1 Tax=Streptomyces gossypii TaxID=2883101 RepID=A0ABT2K1B0_9ACTN|nr:TIGR02452 family protein [Streptomyces gossypii]MCT2593946.1 TIGR02452 family protein [Streptomyces gossypii]